MMDTRLTHPLAQEVFDLYSKDDRRDGLRELAARIDAALGDGLVAMVERDEALAQRDAFGQKAHHLQGELTELRLQVERDRRQAMEIVDELTDSLRQTNDALVAARGEMGAQQDLEHREHDLRTKAEREATELRELLIDKQTPELISCAEMRCHDCGETITSRLGTELKFSRDQALAEVKRLKLAREDDSERARIYREALSVDLETYSKLQDNYNVALRALEQIRANAKSKPAWLIAKNALVRLAGTSDDERVVRIDKEHDEIEVWNDGHAHRYSPTSTLVTLMGALVDAHDCFSFDGSLDALNDGIIRERALLRIARAIERVEHLMPDLRKQQQWDAEQKALSTGGEVPAAPKSLPSSVTLPNGTIIESRSGCALPLWIIAETAAAHLRAKTGGS